MKKGLRMLVLILLAVLMMAKTTMADLLPTIDTVLRQKNWSKDKIEISDNLDAYKIINQEFTDFGDFKMIILERVAPEKEFTAKKYYPPFTGTEEGFPDDFEGVDIGSPRVWIRCDLMKQLPEIYRATSLSDADLLVVLENVYTLGGSLVVTDFKNATDDPLPDFDSVEEMEAYLDSHQKIITAMTYYPKFAVFDILSIYKADTTECLIYDSQYTQAKRFARNPDAALQWTNMEDMKHVIDLIRSGNFQIEDINNLIEEMDFVPQDKKDLWMNCLKSGETDTTDYSMTNYFWVMADELKKLDPNSENREKYDMIIKEKNEKTLSLFVSYCDYSGFEHSIKTIELMKEYLTPSDAQWQEEKMAEFLQLFSN